LLPWKRLYLFLYNYVCDDQPLVLQKYKINPIHVEHLQQNKKVRLYNILGLYVLRASNNSCLYEMFREKLIPSIPDVQKMVEKINIFPIGLLDIQ
jgi:hypothetical protein